MFARVVRFVMSEITSDGCEKSTMTEVQPTAHCPQVRTFRGLTEQRSHPNTQGSQIYEVSLKNVAPEQLDTGTLSIAQNVKLNVVEPGTRPLEFNTNEVLQVPHDG